MNDPNDFGNRLEALDAVTHAQRVVMVMRRSGIPPATLVARAESLLRPLTTRTGVGKIALLELGKSYANAAAAPTADEKKAMWWATAKGCLSTVVAMEDPQLASDAATFLCFRALEVEPFAEATTTIASVAHHLDEETAIVVNAELHRLQRREMIRTGRGTRVPPSEGKSVG